MSRAGASGGHPKATATTGRDELDAWQRQLSERRRFLLQLAGGSLSALFPIGPALADSHSNTNADGSSPGTDTSHEPIAAWPLIDAVQRQLLPSEPNSPGAVEIRALHYLQQTLQAPDHDPEQRRFILQGANWLDEIARQTTGHAFVALSPDQREQVMRRIAASRAGENWLSTLLVYCLEALLTDPVYGGNPDRIGWHWLGHQPGFPRPPRPYWQMDFYRRHG